MTLDKNTYYTERRKKYMRARYYQTKEQLLEGYACEQALAIAKLLNLELSTEQLSTLKDYIKTNFRAQRGVSHE